MSELRGVGGELLGSSSPRLDVVSGWNFKIQNLSPVDLGGIVPFVQLIGLYSEEEINRLVTHEPNYDTDAARVVFVESDGTESGLYQGAGTQVGQAATQEHERFAEKLRNKYIDINITDQNNRDTNNFIPGIVLATNVPQAGSDAYEYYSGTNMPKDSGGVGITDLQIETGTKDFMNRRYKLRLTVTDPQVLNDNPEYLKLTSLQSKFLIIHGWANLHEFGAPGSPPPTIEPDPNGQSNGRMYVDITQQNTGGMWSAATVATTMFDFAFNEVGQLEASFTFMPREISFLATYTLPTISRTYRRFLGTGERTQIDNIDQSDKPPTQFAGFAAGLFAAGSEFGKNLADIIDEEQRAYANSDPTQSIGGLFDFIDTTSGFNAADTLRNWSEESIPFDGTTLALVDEQKQREGRRRFPYAGPGIRVYTKSKRRVQDQESRESPMGQDEFDALKREVDGEPAVWPEDMTAEERNRGTKEVTDYKTHLKYYYLGWLMEAARFSLWDLNRTKAARGETPYNVRFKYMKIPQQSAFNASFQEELNSGLVPDVNKFVSESLNFLKSNCFPGYGIVDPRDLWAQNDSQRNGLSMRPMTEWDLNEGWPDSIERDKAFLDTQGADTFQPDNAGYTSASKPRMQKRLNFYGIIGTLGEGMFAVGADGKTDWDKLHERDKKRQCAGENWRHSLAIDPAHNNALRIMLPPYAGQLLYTYQHPAPLAGYDEDNEESGSLFPSWRNGQDNRVLGDTLGTYVNNYFDWGLMLAPEFKDDGQGILYYGEGGTGPLNEGKIRYLNDAFSEMPFNMVLSYRVKINPGYTLGQDIRNASMMQEPTRYVGDPTESREYGLLMPAQNARFYSGEYIANQRRWYNKHIQYLSNKFDRVIRDRIQEAISSGKTIEDFAAEPVDLYRLTGRVYWPTAFQDRFAEAGEHSNSSNNSSLTIVNESPSQVSERLRDQEFATRKFVDPYFAYDARLDSSSNETHNNLTIALQNSNPFRLEAAPDEYAYYKSAEAAEEIINQLITRGRELTVFSSDDTGTIETGTFQDDVLFFKQAHGSRYVFASAEDAQDFRNPLIFIAPEEYRARDDFGYETSMMSKDIPVYPPGRVSVGGNTSDASSFDNLEQDANNQLQREFDTYYNYTDVDAELQATITDANNELALEEENNKVLFGDGVDTQAINMAHSRLINIDNLSNPTIRQLDSVEGIYAKHLGSKEGLGSVLSFWNERLSKVLVELYNKDLIDLPRDSIIPIVGSKTDASEYSSMRGVYEQAANRERISDTTARKFSNLLSYEVVWVSYDDDDPVVQNIPNDIKTPSELREVTFDIHPAVILDYEVGYHKKIALNNINDIADVGISEMDIRTNNWPANRVALQYSFLNYSSQSDNYLSGVKYIENHPAGLATAGMELVDYIRRSRILIRRYLVNINSLETQIAELARRRDNIIRVRDEAIAAQSSNATTRQILNRNSGISPFTGNLPQDERFIIHKGGGRKVEVNSLVALSWEQRFRRWEVRGVPDIMNYGPKQGGVAYQDKEKRYWGWHTENSKNQTEELSRRTNLGGKANLGDWGSPKSILNIHALRNDRTYEWAAPWAGPGQFDIAGANIDDPADWHKGGLSPRMGYNEDGELVELEVDYDGNPYRAYPIQEGQPNILISADELSSGNIVWAGTPAPGTGNRRSSARPRKPVKRSPAAQPLEDWMFETPIRVKHLVRAGVVDVTLINEILSAKYGWSSIGFEKTLSDKVEWSNEESQEYQRLIEAEDWDGATEYSMSVNNRGMAEKILLGYWPMSMPYLSLSDWENERWDRPGTMEPYYLVDQDLDFVEPAYRQAYSGPASFAGTGAEGEEHLLGLDPTDWVKVNRADCLFAPEINYHLVMYPQSTGYRIGVDEHIPGLPEAAVRQLVNVNGRVAAQKLEYGELNNEDFAKYGYNLRSHQQQFPNQSFRGLEEWSWHSNENFVPEFANNPPLNKVPHIDGKDNQPTRGRRTGDFSWYPSIASIKGTFTSQGYVAYNSVFPFGIPYLNDEWKNPIGFPTVGGMQSSYYGQVIQSQFYPFYNGSRALTVHETLHNLPADFEDGFFSSVVGAGADFTGGAPLNDSLSDLIAEHIFTLLPGGRQIGIHNNIAKWGNEATGDSLHQYEGFEIRDVTYGDLLDNVLNNRETTTANFATQRIDSVAEIPIKREVVDNLLRPNNQNTSLLRFFQQIMSPSAIGLPGNVQLGVRNNNGLVEIFPASISYRGQTTDMFKEAAEAEERANQPENQMLFNYKVKNSLIENIDMSSKMDPAAFLTYQNSSDLLKGRDFNVLKLLSYEGVALEFKQFLDGTLNVDGSGETYSGIISSDASRKIKIDKVKFDAIPSSVLDAFVAQDPERWAKITATMQGQDNFTTELLAFYMRGVSLTIHGTTNLQPFNLIHVTGVMPDLEGIYIITNLTEKVTPTSFQTIIEGKLLKRKRVSSGLFI